MDSHVFQVFFFFHVVVIAFIIVTVPIPSMTACQFLLQREDGLLGRLLPRCR
jgi:hypothetical protein